MGAHPLDSLTGEEFSRTAAILTREHGVDSGWRYASITLQEPPKAEVKAWREGDRIVRRALAVLWNKQSNEVYEAVVNLTDDALQSWTHVPGVTPNFTVDEYHDVDHAMKVHDDVTAALDIPINAAVLDTRSGASTTWMRCSSTCGPTAPPSCPSSGATGGWAGWTSGCAPCPAETPTPTPSAASSSSST